MGDDTCLRIDRLQRTCWRCRSHHITDNADCTSSATALADLLPFRARRRSLAFEGHSDRHRPVQPFWMPLQLWGSDSYQGGLWGKSSYRLSWFHPPSNRPWWVPKSHSSPSSREWTCSVQTTSNSIKTMKSNNAAIYELGTYLLRCVCRWLLRLFWICLLPLVASMMPRTMIVMRCTSTCRRVTSPPICWGGRQVGTDQPH